MGQTNTTVEINGTHYDAVTGAVVEPPRRGVAKPAATVHSKVHRTPRGQSVDGFARPNRDAAIRAAIPKADISTAVKKPAAHPDVTRVRQAEHVKHHKQQRATTLMRTAVKKPQVKSAEVIKAQTRTDLLAKVPEQKIVPKLSYGSVSHQRQLRAKRLNKSAKVTHFNESVLAPTGQITRHVLPVSSAAPKASTRSAHSTQVRGFDFIKPTVASTHLAPATHAVQPQPRQRSTYIAGKPQTSKVRSSEIFEQALANATSHEQTFEDLKAPRTNKRKRALGYVIAGFAALTLIGFLGLHNADQINLQVASYRSGLHAKLPTYQPADYTLDKLAYQPGAVTASFNSASTKSNYQISQKESNWDSQTLLANVVSSAKSGYKTYQQAGRTIYIIGNNTATWVDSGVLYTVDGNADLSSKQLLDLASSM